MSDGDHDFDDDDRHDSVELHGWTFVKETASAYGVRAAADDDIVWLPKSQVRGGSLGTADAGDDDVWFMIPRWLADDRGIEYDD